MWVSQVRSAPRKLLSLLLEVGEAACFVAASVEFFTGLQALMSYVGRQVSGRICHPPTCGSSAVGRETPRYLNFHEVLA